MFVDVSVSVEHQVVEFNTARQSWNTTRVVTRTSVCVWDCVFVRLFHTKWRPELRVAGKYARGPTGVLLQTKSSSFCWSDKGIPGDLLLHSTCTVAVAHICVSAVAVFSLSDPLHPGGFGRTFARLLPKRRSCTITATRRWSHLQRPTASKKSARCLSLEPRQNRNVYPDDRPQLRSLSSPPPPHPPPSQSRRPITQPDNTIHTVSNESFQHHC